jgi:hypothetical protein
MCRHEGKSFANLSTHFLGKHTEYMKVWLREELDLLEEAAFAKLNGAESAAGSRKHELTSEEEVETSVT